MMLIMKTTLKPKLIEVNMKAIVESSKARQSQNVVSFSSRFSWDWELEDG